MERYLAEHIDYYESEKMRWSDCELEQWKAGADGEYNLYMILYY